MTAYKLGVASKPGPAPPLFSFQTLTLFIARSVTLYGVVILLPGVLELWALLPRHPGFACARTVAGSSI